MIPLDQRPTQPSAYANANFAKKVVHEGYGPAPIVARAAREAFVQRKMETHTKYFHETGIDTVVYTAQRKFFPNGDVNYIFAIPDENNSRDLFSGYLIRSIKGSDTDPIVFVGFSFSKDTYRGAREPGYETGPFGDAVLTSFYQQHWHNKKNQGRTARAKAREGKNYFYVFQRENQRNETQGYDEQGEYRLLTPTELQSLLLRDIGLGIVAGIEGRDTEQEENAAHRSSFSSLLSRVGFGLGRPTRRQMDEAYIRQRNEALVREGLIDRSQIRPNGSIGPHIRPGGH